MPRNSQTVKYESTVSNAAPISDTNCKFRGIPKTTLRFNNFHRTPWKLIFMVTVYYREKIKIASSQRKRHIEQSLGGFQTWSFHSPFLELTCNNGHRVLKIRKLNQASVSLVFIGWTTLVDCSHGWTQSLAQLIPHEPKSPP